MTRDFTIMNDDDMVLWVERDANEPEDGGNQYIIGIDGPESAQFWFKNEGQAKEFVGKFAELLTACNNSATETAAK